MLILISDIFYEDIVYNRHKINNYYGSCADSESMRYLTLQCRFGLAQLSEGISLH